MRKVRIRIQSNGADRPPQHAAWTAHRLEEEPENRHGRIQVFHSNNRPFSRHASGHGRAPAAPPRRRGAAPRRRAAAASPLHRLASGVVPGLAMVLSGVALAQGAATRADERADTVLPAVTVTAHDVRPLDAHRAGIGEDRAETEDRDAQRGRPARRGARHARHHPVAAPGRPMSAPKEI